VIAGLLLGGIVAGGGWILVRGLLRGLLRWAASTPLRVAVPVDA